MTWLGLLGWLVRTIMGGTYGAGYMKIIGDVIRVVIFSM